MQTPTNEDSLGGSWNRKNDSVHSSRLAYTGRIAAGIAHEIRNPLSNVSLSVEQLREAFAEDGPWAKHIEVIIRNTKRINFLITELLNGARPPKLNIEPHDIHEILESTLSSIKFKVEAQRIKVSKRFKSKMPLINVDREQVKRAFSNVMVNSLEAMPDGGKMAITTDVEEGFLVVNIEDTGEGIPEEDIIMIFDPFFSTKPSGVGLGLAITYGIVISHGGTIIVESKAERGTLIAISLPIKQSQEESS